jgi:hypothetical protein
MDATTDPEYDYHVLGVSSGYVKLLAARSGYVMSAPAGGKCL